jgi:hypothetical protein
LGACSLLYQGRDRDSRFLQSIGACVPDYKGLIPEDWSLNQEVQCGCHMFKYSDFSDVKFKTDNDVNEMGIRKLALYVSTKILLLCTVKFTFTALRVLALCHIAAACGLL